jgi:hypothetical protein
MKTKVKVTIDNFYFDHKSESVERRLGEFEFKLMVSPSKSLQIEEDLRLLVGANLENASANALQQAQMISELRGYLIQAPEWWNRNGNGAELDLQLLMDLYSKFLEERASFSEELTKKLDSVRVKKENEAKP